MAPLDRTRVLGSHESPALISGQSTLGSHKRSRQPVSLASSSGHVTLESHKRSRHPAYPASSSGHGILG
eukprot:gene11076-18683_t